MNISVVSTPRSEELQLQMELLLTPIGGANSGYNRYSAAMYFYKHGKLSAELLEIYRRCCKLNEENPIELARHEGVSVDFVETLQAGGACPDEAQ